MQRRSFLAGLVATAAGLLVPEPDVHRVYSFPSSRYLRRADLAVALKNTAFLRIYEGHTLLAEIPLETGFLLVERDPLAFPAVEGLDFRGTGLISLTGAAQHARIEAGGFETDVDLRLNSNAFASGGSLSVSGVISNTALQKWDSEMSWDFKG